MSTIIVSDCLAKLGGAVMALRDSLDRMGTATGFVVNFSCDLQQRFPHDICRVSLKMEP